MKKSSTKKPPIKNTKSKKKPFKLFALSNILVAITAVAFIIIGYMYVSNENKITNNIKNEKIKEEKLKQEIIEDKISENEEAKYFEEKTKALEIEYVSNIDNQVYIDEKKVELKDKFKYKDNFKEETPTYIKQINDNIISKEKLIEKEVIKEIEPKLVKKEIDKKEKINLPIKKQDTGLPKLAVIIDDVTTSGQIKRIQDIGYIVNMAFLPPTKHHRNSAKVTNNLNDYMIHLPLEASSHKFEEVDTLYIGHSIEKIDNKIKTLKSLYPKATFINNHTGSKYTSNEVAMDKLLKVLKKYNYTFIDSKTTANSVVLKSAKKYGMRVLTRNIFLDNKKDKKYIQKQLKRAVAIAKRNGSAIAIGHPYSITFSTLKQSKHLLKGVELVFVQSL